MELSAPSPNPYRDLVEKYEALLELHNSAFDRNHQGETPPVSVVVAKEELTSGDYSSINTNATKDMEQEQRIKEITDATGAKRKICLRTPTDFSETETSSSGFSDEISNKQTQTEETFLCTIADGDDKFSIYDETSPIDSRFRHCPKYRHLFKEIFATLKKAAENKDDGEKLPLLDDTNPAFKVPPVTPAVEELPPFPADDTESIASSVVSEQSIAMSECVTKHERKTVMEHAKKTKEKIGQENKPPTQKDTAEASRILTHQKREPLEYLAFSNLRKKNKRRGRNTSFDPSDSPVLPSTPRFFYSNLSKKRRERLAIPANKIVNRQIVDEDVWNGGYSRNQSPTPSNGKRNQSGERAPEGENVVFKRTTASHDLHKLIKLDLSYAEVLRRADQCKHNRRK